MLARSRDRRRSPFRAATSRADRDRASPRAACSATASSIGAAIPPGAAGRGEGREGSGVHIAAGRVITSAAATRAGAGGPAAVDSTRASSSAGPASAASP